MTVPPRRPVLIRPVCRLLLAALLCWGLSATATAAAAEMRPALRLVAEQLEQAAQTQGGAAAQPLARLAQGLRSGTMSLEEVEIALRIIGQLQGANDRGHLGGRGGQAVPAPAAQDPAAVLGLLDSPAPTPGPGQRSAPGTEAPSAEDPSAEDSEAMSIAELEAWAGAQSPDLADPDEEEADPAPAAPAAQGEEPSASAADDFPDGPQPAPQPLATANPDLPSDQADLPAIDARVRLVETRQVGERDLQMVFIDRGAAHGLAEGHRLRVERSTETVVLLSVFNVRQEMAVAVVLEGTWTTTSNREIREGDRVVRDR